jgi:hypothetical protein
LLLLVAVFAAAIDTYEYSRVSQHFPFTLMGAYYSISDRTILATLSQLLRVESLFDGRAIIPSLGSVAGLLQRDDYL